MNTENRRFNFLRNNFHTVGTLPLFVLLLLVQTLLTRNALCPYGLVINRVYGSFFLVLPLILLFSLSLMMRTRRSAGLLSTDNCSFRYILYITAQAGKAPLIWFLLSLIDGRYITCLARFYSYRSDDDIQSMTQVSGLVGLVVFLFLDYALPQSTFARKQWSYFFRQRQEDLILQEVEIVLQQKAEERRKAFVEDMVHSALDQLKPENFWETDDLVWKYKQMTLRSWSEISEGALLQKNEYDATEQEHKHNAMEPDPVHP